MQMVNDAVMVLAPANHRTDQPYMRGGDAGQT